MKIYKKTGYLFWNCLVFSFLFTSCHNEQVGGDAVAIVWEKQRAVGIRVPNDLIKSFQQDSIQDLLEVRLKDNSIAILGNYEIKSDGVEFRPVLSFVPGLIYDVWFAGKFLDEFTIPLTGDSARPVIVNVYPSQDTLPENLLKFYILFSKPMQEGVALDHIRLIGDNKDTISTVFLDLQPELWNRERTMLTLWFDPGRIKRDLQPNKLLGPPLKKGRGYQLLIKQGWQDENGLTLNEGYKKLFYTIDRDSTSPDLKKWKLEIPKAGSNSNLSINFDEPLDPILAENTMQIIDANESVVKGKFEVNNDGKQVTFIPVKNWGKGGYRLEVESRLEDFAGNNLDRPFDADLLQSKHEPKEIYIRVFKID